MSGRGRRGGRGRGSGLSFNVESIGFGRGDPLPPPIAQPPALFPPLDFKPTPLISNEEQDYLLNLKQELRGTLCDSGFYIKPVIFKKDIDRYSDKYQQTSINNGIKLDWNRFPKELRETSKSKKRSSATKPTACKKKTKEHIGKEVSNKLEVLESAERTSTSDDEQDEEKNEEIDREEEEYDDEEQEEGNDYTAEYFDNGEDFLDEDDNLDDGPIY